MREYLIDLLTRMATKDVPHPKSSADSISWQAYREVEKLDDPTAIDELESYLTDAPMKERAAAYVVLAKLAVCLKEPRCTSILLFRVPLGTNKYILSSLLDLIEGVPKTDEMNFSVVYALLHDERWLVRYSAICALRGAQAPEAEDRILECMEKSSDPNDFSYCHSVLSSIGTLKALPLLAKMYILGRET